MTRQEAIRILSRREAIDALAPDKNVGSKGDTIYRQDAIRVVSGLDSSFVKYIEELPSVQPEHLTDDDFETIRIHLSAFKEKLGNQGRWKEAQEYQRLIDRFMAFASAQPEQKWVLCSEQLPEDEYVLISKKPTKISGSKWSVAIAIRTADPRSGKIQWRDSGFSVIQDDKVLAWMPLPKGYSGE